MERYEVDGILSNLRQYLEGHGINTSRLFHCINPQHIDSNASMKYFDDDRVYCFGCGASYNLVDVIGIMENLNKSEAFKQTLKYYGKNYYNVRPIQKETKQNNKNYEKAYNVWQYNLRENQTANLYLKSRGLDDKTIKKFKIGYNSFDFGDYKLNAVVIPINNHCFTARNILNEEDGIRYYKSKGCQLEIFNSVILKSDIKYCVITEGEFDCLSFESIGINAISLGSANNIHKFIEQEKSNKITYILALDNDEAGQNAKNSLIDYFNNNGIKYIVFDNCGYKDANQALVENKELFKKSIYDIVNTIDNSNNRKNQSNSEM